MNLLPTPTASNEVKDADSAVERARHSPSLSAVSYHFPAITKLLPTPLTTDAQGAGGHGDGGRDLRTTVSQDWDSSAWDKYAEAIDRWEMATNAWAPVPVELNRNGNFRLNAKFSEWMMGWPKGWVTDLITSNRRLYGEGMVSRTAAMKMIGNGVVPQQAVMAIDTLMKEW